jgi:hypothetical protein
MDRERVLVGVLGEIYFLMPQAEPTMKFTTFYSDFLSPCSLNLSLIKQEFFGDQSISTDIPSRYRYRRPLEIVSYIQQSG